MNAFLETLGGGLSRDVGGSSGSAALELAVDAAAERIGSGLITGAHIDSDSLAVLATQRTGVDIKDLILGSIDSWAADYFSAGTTAWSAAPVGCCPWQSYRARAAIDPCSELLGLDRVRTHFAALPGSATRVLVSAASELNWDSACVEREFRALWGDVSRWSEKARAQGWIGRNRGRDHAAPRQLLAIRVSWELVLHRALGLDRVSRKAIAGVWYA